MSFLVSNLKHICIFVPADAGRPRSCVTLRDCHALQRESLVVTKLKHIQKDFEMRVWTSCSDVLPHETTLWEQIVLNHVRNVFVISSFSLLLAAFNTSHIFGGLCFTLCFTDILWQWNYRVLCYRPDRLNTKPGKLFWYVTSIKNVLNVSLPRYCNVRLRFIEPSPSRYTTDDRNISWCNHSLAIGCK